MDYKEKIIALLNDKELSQEQKEKLESIFPELKNEDERIRKEITFFIAANHKDDAEKAHWLYWLENQKQKPIVLDIDKMVDDYANSSERGNEEFGKPVNCMIRAYRQGLNDAISEIVLKPGEWSDGDYFKVRTLIDAIKSGKQIRPELRNEYVDWLKSIDQRVMG